MPAGTTTRVPCALTIAGSDSSGGAGIQADLRTFAALEAYGASAVTAVTSQNTLGVRAVVALEPAFVAEQIDAVLDDIPVGAIKTGMLANQGIVEAVTRELLKCNVPVVVDPVMVAKSGAALLDDAAVDVVKTRLLPRAALVTPNLAEAERLVGFRVRNLEEQEHAARALVALGAAAALVKGGHGSGDPVDVLFDGSTVETLTSTRIDTPHTHGTGCTYAAAICALLARGRPLVEAVFEAHTFVREAIRQAPGLGRGHGPLHPMHPWYRW
jgi:hydroxymethylpyrimidine/phosphomethylpyrimidine kinase